MVARIEYFILAQLMHAQSIERLFDYYKILINIKINQYFCARRDDNRPMADSHLTSLTNIDYFVRVWFLESIARVVKVLLHVKEMLRYRTIYLHDNVLVECAVSVSSWSVCWLDSRPVTLDLQVDIISMWTQFVPMNLLIV